MVITFSITGIPKFRRPSSAFCSSSTSTISTIAGSLAKDYSFPCLFQAAGSLLPVQSQARGSGSWRRLSREAVRFCSLSDSCLLELPPTTTHSASSCRMRISGLHLRALPTVAKRASRVSMLYPLSYTQVLILDTRNDPCSPIPALSNTSIHALTRAYVHHDFSLAAYVLLCHISSTTPLQATIQSSL